MGYLIEVKEDKVEKLSDHIEKGLHHLGRAMSCVEAMMGHEFGERDDMGYREHESYGRYGRHDGDIHERYPYMGYREHDDWDDEDDMHERRKRSRRTGRYM